MLPLSMLARPRTRRRGSAFTALFAALSVALMPALADAQATPEPPYTGVIAFDTVEARGSAGRMFYPVAELKRGDTVTVEDPNFLRWFRVQPPASVRAVVSEAFVEASGDGTTGRVINDMTQVRVLGIDRSAADSFKGLKLLSRGETVRILGRESGLYIIEPPAGSLVFLPPGSVVPLEEHHQQAQAESPSDADAGLVVHDADDAAVETSADLATPTTAEAAPVGPAGDMVPLDAEFAGSPTEAADTPATEDGTLAAEATETMTADASANTLTLNDPEPAPTVQAGSLDTTQATEVVFNPAESESESEPITEAASVEDTSLEVDDADAVEAGQATDASGSPAPTQAVETPAINAELRRVELRMLPLFALNVDEQPLDEMEAAYQQIASEQTLGGIDTRIVDSRLIQVRRNRQLAAALQQIAQRQQGVARVEPVVVEIDLEDPYAAVGTLRVSSVLTAAGQTTFRVIDPATRRTIAYVQPAADVDPALSLGRVVGVRGERQYDDALNAHLIIASQIRVLDAVD